MSERTPSAARTPARADRELPGDYTTGEGILEGFVERAASPDALADEGHDPAVIERAVEPVEGNERTRAQPPPGAPGAAQAGVDSPCGTTR